MLFRQTSVLPAVKITRNKQHAFFLKKKKKKKKTEDYVKQSNDFAEILGSKICVPAEKGIFWIYIRKKSSKGDKRSVLYFSAQLSISIGKTCVIFPIPWVLPVRNSSLDPVLMNSGCCKKRKSTEAVSLVTICLAAIIPSSTAVCWMLPMCTVVWKPLCMLVEWNSTTIVAYNRECNNDVVIFDWHNNLLPENKG